MAVLRYEFMKSGGAKMRFGGDTALTAGVFGAGTVPTSASQLAEGSRIQVPVPTDGGSDDTIGALKALGGPLYVKWAPSAADAAFAGAGATDQDKARSDPTNTKHLSAGEFWPIAVPPGWWINVVDAPSSDA
ncbi:hypothetical protein [Blastochloris tepida]|nr:hypothetical protein [Blastochloris tepida]